MRRGEKGELGDGEEGEGGGKFCSRIVSELVYSSR